MMLGGVIIICYVSYDNYTLKNDTRYLKNILFL